MIIREKYYNDVCNNKNAAFEFCSQCKMGKIWQSINFCTQEEFYELVKNYLLGFTSLNCLISMSNNNKEHALKSLDLFVYRLIETPLEKILDLIENEEYNTNVLTSADIPQFSSLEQSFRTIQILSRKAYINGISYSDLGEELGDAKTPYRSLGAREKFGENQAKTMAMLDLVTIFKSSDKNFEKKFYVKSNLFSNFILPIIFGEKSNEAITNKLIARLSLRNKLFRNLYTLDNDKNRKETEEIMLSISTLTRRRRIPNINKIASFFFNELQNKKKKNIYDNLINNLRM